MIRPRGASTRRRDDEERSRPSAQEIGHLLQTAREERGLDLLAVHDRLSRPITQIEALEDGDLDRLEDRDAAVTAVRRYATFLGLDGEELARRFDDAWAAHDGASPRRGDDTRAVPVPVGATARGAGPSTTAVVPVDHDPEHLRAFTQTGEVPRFGVAPRAATGNAVGPPTGTFPVVPKHDLRASRRALARARRRQRAPGWLKALTWIAAVCLLIVAAGWAVRTWSPTWLIQAHILRTTHNPSGAKGPVAGPVERQGPAVQPVAANGQGTGFVVAGAPFTVTIATSGPCWVRVISSTSAVPLLDAVQPANQVFSYKAHGTMTITVGASAVVVGVSLPGHAPYLNKPSVAPYTYTFYPPGTVPTSTTGST